jgi:hypothetical protein
MSDFYLNERLMRLRVEEEHRQADFRRLPKALGSRDRGWLGRRRARALRRLGGLLVSLGRHLLRSIPPQTPHAEGA